MTTTSRTTKHAKRDDGPITLSIDIGGTGLKASVLDAEGRKVVDRVRVRTPYPCPPRVLVKALDKLTFELPPWATTMWRGPIGC